MDLFIQQLPYQGEKKNGFPICVGTIKQIITLCLSIFPPIIFPRKTDQGKKWNKVQAILKNIMTES